MSRIFFFFLFLVFSVVGQSQDEVEVYHKEDGNKVLIMGKNNLGEDVEVTLNLEYKGYQSSDVFPKKVMLKAREEKALTTLVTPPATACEFSISLSYKKLLTGNQKTTRTTGIQINPVKVNVFTRDNCARCAFVVESFEKNKVVFLELNTSIAPENLDLMFAKLKEAGYQSTEVQMPVVVYQDKVYYNIPDLKSFIKQFQK